MSMMEVTIWFKARPSPERLHRGYAEAALAGGFSLSLFKGKECFENTILSWSGKIEGFKPYAFTEEIKWLFTKRDVSVKGKTYFQMLDPVNYFGTVEFDVKWTGREIVGFGGDLAGLGSFLSALVFSVDGMALFVAPKKLPDDIQETRSRRFEANPDRHTPLRTKIDWICGLKAQDAQCALFDNLLPVGARVWERDGFRIYLLKDVPFEYKKEADRRLIEEMERIVGISG